MHPTSPHDPSGADCTACSALGTSRRAFLRDAAIAVAGALVAAGAGADAAHAQPLEFVEPLAVRRAPGGAESRTYPIPAADGATIDRESDVILARWQGAVYAFSLACPHQNTALRWQPAESRFQCPKHKSKYRPDGSFIEGRATRGMDRYAIRREGATVVVDLAILHEQDEDPTGWTSAVVRVG